MKSTLKQLCMISRLEGFAGPAAFQKRLEEGLVARGVKVCYDPQDANCDAALVIGGTRRLSVLRGLLQRGIPIYQRLNGMNWIHRRVRTGIQHFLRAEMANMLLRTVRGRFASGVIYQSEFARGWWERVYGATPVPSTVIHNAVPLDVYTPDGDHSRPEDRKRILVVEGNLAGGYETGIHAAFKLADRLLRQHSMDVELHIAGHAPQEVRGRLDGTTNVPVTWLGPVPPENIPALDRSAHMLYSSDINPACPNSVVEALACGLPVAAFDTGSLPELVTEDAGMLAPYGGDPWKLQPPDIPALARAALDILHDQERFRAGARRRAVEHFGLDRMVTSYLAAMSD